MRGRRVLGDGERNFYHVVSRVVDGRFVFGEAEKRHFRHLMGRLLGFSGLRCVTFCLMDNHFHLLLEVPEAEGAAFRAGASAEEVLGRAALLYDAGEMAGVRGRYEELLGMGSSGGGARDYIGGLVVRMYDLSVFVKELKARFTMWYNRRNGRAGTLWEERFRSVLCEGSREVLTAVAGYIDLNPVRAGLVEDPKDYRWSGYGEAVAGEKGSRRGLAQVLDPGGEDDRAPDWRRTQKGYRVLLYGAGLEELGGGGRRARAGLSRAAVEKVLGEKGELTAAQVLRCRVRYFTEGLVIGGSGFLEGFFRGQRWRFGEKRKTGARPMGGARWGGLGTVRDLRGPAISMPDAGEAERRRRS
jgi:REP element-mobilizing transposase RayT